MKVSTVAAFTACAVRVAAAVTFGPSNCVSLSQSAAQTCVLATNCEGVSLAAFDFAFDCESSKGDGSVVRHSFGKGGFDPNEEFDTEVVCARCLAPSADDVEETEDAAPAVAAVAPPVAAVAPQPAQNPPQPVQNVQTGPVTTAPVVHQQKVTAVANAASASSTALAKAAVSSSPDAAKAEPAPKGAVSYGPRGCVSTYKNKDGHCVMKTACSSADIENYDFGLVCVDKAGAPVRHLFGVNSFDPQETFDTLITCNQCLGLEDIPDAVALNGQVLAISQEMKEMKDMMKMLGENVEKLNEAVFTKKPVPAIPAAAPAAAPPASPSSVPAVAAVSVPTAPVALAPIADQAAPVAEAPAGLAAPVAAVSTQPAAVAVQPAAVAAQPEAVPALPVAVPAQPAVQNSVLASQDNTGRRHHRHHHHHRHHRRHRRRDEDEDEDEDEDDDRDEGPRSWRHLRGGEEPQKSQPAQAAQATNLAARRGGNGKYRLIPDADFDDETSAQAPQQVVDMGDDFSDTFDD